MIQKKSKKNKQNEFVEIFSTKKEILLINQNYKFIEQSIK